jgi:antitoxin (DNA-binding transcriptional repressor) of toxin-antitoxin stability system
MRADADESSVSAGLDGPSAERADNSPAKDGEEQSGPIVAGDGRPAMRISPMAAEKAKSLRMEVSDSPAAPSRPAEELEARPEMVCFRGQTIALVRHFFELSSQVGRLPSLLGREFFRARVSHHAIPSFEDQAVFVHDVELCLSRLNAEHQEIMMLVGLYNLSHDEVAEMLHVSRSSIRLWFAEAMDALSEIFLAAGLLSEQRPDRRQRQLIHAGLPKDVDGVNTRPPQGWKSDEEVGNALEFAPAMA